MNRVSQALALLFVLSSAEAKTFQYIYVEANEGTASGGHAAVKFDDEVFHYQYRDGLIRLHKDDSEKFSFDYRYLQNRSLHVADIDIAPDGFALLQDHFKTQFWNQERQFKRLQSLQRDAGLLSWLAGLENARQPKTQNSGLQLMGAGLFYSDDDFAGNAATSGTCGTEVAAHSVLSELHARIARQYGADFLQQRSQALTTAIMALTPAAYGPANQPSGYGFADRYLDQLNALLALRVIQERRNLTRDACHAPAGPEWGLSSTQLAALKDYRQQLLANASALLNSKRPDWGQALCVALARLVALQQSLNSGRWVFLDDFGMAAERIATRTYAGQAPAMQQQYQQAKRHWHQQQQLVEHKALDDRTYTALEQAANRYYEWQTSQTLHSLRYRGQQALPLKALELPNWIVPNLPPERLQQSLQTITGQVTALNDELKTQYEYDLLARNCVTELFRSINLALGPETGQILGSRIDPDSQFVPFLAFAQLRQRYPVAQSHVHASFRHQGLAEFYAQDFPPWVFLRESNIFSAKLYQYNPDDAAFVFFTDDGFLLRPLFGAVNTLTGLGQSFIGLLEWPFDEGARLRNGTRGLLMSLPELAFINIRKGSYKFAVPPVAIPGIDVPESHP